MIYVGKTSLKEIFAKLKGYFAPIDNPVLTGTPTAPTADGTIKEQVANVEFVKKYVASQLQSDINYTITITQSDNQTITVTAGGVAHTETFTAPKGTDYTVSIQAADGYTAGTLSTTGGTLDMDIIISATPAVTASSGDGGSEMVVVDDSTVIKSLTFPAGFNVLKITMENTGSVDSYTGVMNKNNQVWWTGSLIDNKLRSGETVTKYVGITPGKEYKLSFGITTENFSAGKGRFTISWSPEINTQTPEVTDY